ncbi:MAG TPA: hypothetical protein VEX38_01025 [Fimbriimonadaceae bacterium]|nr:hypothetical protein [Fimbriimonadaceae bacterium]
MKSWTVAVALGFASIAISQSQVQARESAPGAAAAQKVDLRQSASLARGLENKHPSEYYKRAAELFQTGRRDDAVFIYYLGQLRWRIYIKANPSLPPDGDPALFASLSVVMGRPINQYAFGDIPVLVRTMQAVLDFDQAYPDRFTSRTAKPRQRQEVRKGLADLRSDTLAQADFIRAERLKNGLENRN